MITGIYMNRMYIHVRTSTHNKIVNKHISGITTCTSTCRCSHKKNDQPGNQKYNTLYDEPTGILISILKSCTRTFLNHIQVALINYVYTCTCINMLVHVHCNVLVHCNVQVHGKAKVSFFSFKNIKYWKYMYMYIYRTCSPSFTFQSVSL